MLGVTTVRTLDMFAIQQLLIHGKGAGLSTTLKQLELELHRSDTATLLSFALQKAPVHNASLAIAAWWPRLKHEAVIRDLLVEKLADPALGGAAALALAVATMCAYFVVFGVVNAMQVCSLRLVTSFV